MGVGNTGDIDVLEKALTAENDIGPLRVSEDIDGMDFSFGEEIETEKGNLTEQIFDSWRSRMDVLELRIQLLGVLRKMALGEIGPGDVAAMVEASSASFLYLQNTKDNQSELSVESSNVTPPTFLSEWISEIPADIRVLEDEVMPVKCNLGPCREADRNAEKDMSSGGKVEADQGVTGELTPARCWRRINELRLRLELLENLRKMESGEFSGEEMQERSREVCTRWSGYDTEAAHWQALDEQQNPAQAFTGLQTAEDKEMNVAYCTEEAEAALTMLSSWDGIAGSMTAPITTTSFGSSKLSSQSPELNHRSPLKRTHSDRQAPEDRRLEDGQRGRPIKKIKQGETAEGQEPDGLVARLFKYAWQFIGSTPEDLAINVDHTAKAIEEDKLQILRRMMDKDEIRVPEHNPTIDLTADSDNEDSAPRNGITASKGDKPSRKGKERASFTPRTAGVTSFKLNGSLFQNEINLPEDDSSLRHSTRKWHSPASRTNGTALDGQGFYANKSLQRSTLGPPTWSTQRPITPTRPKPGQTSSTLGNSIAKLDSVRKGSVASTSASVSGEAGRDRWGLNAKQRDTLEKTVPRFKGTKRDKVVAPQTMTSSGEAYRQLLNTFRAAEGVGERLSLSLSTLELAKAWTESGLGYRNADLTKSTTSSATPKVKASKQERWLHRQREISQKAYEEIKARDETAKEIAEELERLALEEDKLREEALAQARARALKKIEVPELDEEQLAEVNRQVKNPHFRSNCDRDEVTQKELLLLTPGQWLNDEVINFYGAMLMARAKAEGKRKIHFFNSFFFTKIAKDGYEKSKVGRWTKKIDIFALDIVIFPINQNNMHWVCGAINMKDKRFEYYDSLSTKPDQRAFVVMREYLQKEHMDKKKKPIDLSDWEDYWDPKGPQQLNGSDCGVFACQTLEHRARGVGDKGDDVTESAAWEFEQKHMIGIRNLMRWELIQGKIAKRGNDD